MEPNSRADTLTAWIEGLTLTTGGRVGEPFKLFPWERDFVRGALAPGISIAALSVGRSAGKSTLCAAIAAAAIAGPLAVPRGEAFVVASSVTQARIVWEDALAFLDARYQVRENRERWRLRESDNRTSILDRETRAQLRVLSSDPARAHGIRPVVIIADEPSAWKRTAGQRMLNILETSLGKVPGSKLFLLGTRPADEDHFFAGFLASTDPSVYSQVHAAPDHVRLEDPRGWRMANPSLGQLGSGLEDIVRAEASRAAQNAEAEAGFRALRLNQGVAESRLASVMEAATWLAAEGDADRSGDCIWGVDLGGTAAMSAVALYWPSTGRLEAVAAFPRLPADIRERERRDSVPEGAYSGMVDAGELHLLGDATVPVEALLAIALGISGPPAALLADQYRRIELAAGMQTVFGGHRTLIPRSRSWQAASEDLRLFREAFLDGEVTPARSLLLRAALGAAVVVTDQAGNSRLGKATEGGRRRKARDDSLAAALLAVAHARRASLHAKVTPAAGFSRPRSRRTRR